MAIVRQLPNLYLRGSLCNVTMANLTQDQRRHVEELTELVANHPDMQKHRVQVIRELADTIGADYREDRAAAEQEFRVAIWRGVVNLFYHRHYSFRCQHCGQSTYLTKRHKPKPINRIQTPCPNCDHVRVVKSGATNLVEGSYVTIDEFQAAYADLHDDLPECESTIEAVAGDRRYDNAEEIINDPKQLTKFFGEFVWNYFRQQLRENSRVEHCKTPQEIVGPADEIIAQEIVCTCAKMHLDHNYCIRTQPEHGWYHIQISGLQTPPEFTCELVVLLEKAKQNGIEVQFDDNEIRVAVTPDAATLKSFVVKPEHVMVMDNAATSDDDENAFTINQVSFKTVGARKMIPDDHVAAVEYDDIMSAVYDALPDGDCKRVFQLCRQDGAIYDEFSSKYGDGEPKQTHMARFLGITPRTVRQYMDAIRLTCLANELVPN